MPRLPTAAEIPTLNPQPDRRIASYQPGIAQDAAIKAYGEDAQSDLQTGQALSTGFGQLRQGAEQVAQAQDEINSVTAYGEFLTKKLALDQQFETDTDYTTAPQRYSQQIQQTAQQASSRINSPLVRAEFMDRVGRMQEYGMDAMVRLAHAKSVDADRSYTKDYVGGILDQAAQAPDETTRSQLFNNAGSLVDAMVGKGSLKADEGRALKQSLPNLYGTRKAKEIADTDPGLLLQIAPGAETIPAHPMVNGDLGIAINHAASKYGVSIDTLARIAQLESNGGQNTRNPTSGARGPFQFMPQTAAQYGLTDPEDDGQSADAAARLLANNTAALTQNLGRQPTGGELYLAHQQGADGASALLTNPNQNAIQTLAEATGSIGKARQAVLQNGGTQDMTAGQFASLWQKKFNGTPGAAQPQSVADPSQVGTAFPKMGDWRDFVRPDQWADLTKSAQTRVDAQLNHQLSLQKYQDEQADKQLKQFQSTNDAGILADAAQGKPQDSNQIADMLRYRMVTESGFKAWQAEMTRQGKGADDPSVVANLDRRARAGEDIGQDVNNAITNLSIKGTTGVQLIHTMDAAQKGGADRTRADALNLFKASTGGDTVEKGLINFGNQAEVARAQRYAQGLMEWGRRVDLNHEDPWAVVNDMLPRYTSGPVSLEALPHPRMGVIQNINDVATVKDKTQTAFDAGQLPADQFYAEQGLITQYYDFFLQQQRQLDAAAAAKKAQPAGPQRRTLGVTEGP